MSKKSKSIFSNSFTKHAGVEFPIICGAMYPCSNPELVAAKIKQLPYLSSIDFINATDLFNYILSSGNNEQQQNKSTPNSEQSCSVDELSGFCNNDSCRYIGKPNLF